MSFRLVDKSWDHELADALRADASTLRIVCPFIKTKALNRFLKIAPPKAMQVITRFNLVDFSEGVSDIAALRVLLEQGAQVRGVQKLHAKLYLFGGSRAVLTSANLTDAALQRNHEFGFVSDDSTIMDSCSRYFKELWQRAGADLKRERLDVWEEKVSAYLAGGGRPATRRGLRDEGVDAGAAAEAVILPPWVDDARRAFVKFLGEGDNRAPLTKMTLEEVKRSGCHWAVAYPKGKRPRQVQDGDLIFIARLTSDPNDIRIFGRAVGMKHQEGRDDATPQDIAQLRWKKDWPLYIRVHHPEFVAGSLANGVSLNELMESLKAHSFAPTQRNLANGEGNTDPRRAYRQQASVELSPQGLAWVNERLQAALAAHGRLPTAELDELGWPDVPRVAERSRE